MSRTARDRIVSAVCTLLQLLNIQPGSSPEPSAPAAAIASAAGLAAGLSLLARRRAPLVVLAVATAGYVVQAAVAGPSLPAALTVAAYSAARHGPPLWGAVWAVASALALASVLASTGDIETAPPYVVGILLAVLAGALMTTRAARQSAMLRDAAVDERLRIARDLHDIVGHGVGAITVQAGAGRMALDVNAHDDVRRALISIERAGRDVLREVRWLVGLMRDQPERPGLVDIAALSDAATRAGLTVDCHVTGAVAAVRGPSQEAAYRIVQEALTNVVRHSGASRGAVRVEVADCVTVEVRDEGEWAGEALEGNGIRGMRERAAALGGDLRAGAAEPGPGWVVVATLPTTTRPVNRR